MSGSSEGLVKSVALMPSLVGTSFTASVDAVSSASAAVMFLLLLLAIMGACKGRTLVPWSVYMLPLLMFWSLGVCKDLLIEERLFTQ